MPWSDSLSETLGPRWRAKVAKGLHGDWRKEDRRAAGGVEVASLATKLGELANPQAANHASAVKWFGKRDALLQLLAERAGVTSDVIIGGGAVLYGLGFPEFPALKPLRVNEEPCAFDRDGWLVHRAITNGHRWIVARAGSGKTLVVRYMQARLEREFAAVSVPNLGAALQHIDVDRPLIIDVDAASSDDTNATHRLALRARPTTVLAPFPPAVPTGWDVVSGEPPAGWRDRLLAWLEERLQQMRAETWIDKSEALRWLDENDPGGRLVSTPGDLLSLCADFHLQGGDGTLVARGERWLSRACSNWPVDDGSARGWARHAGAKTFVALAEAELARVDAPLGGLAPTAWEAMVPASVVSDGAGTTVVVGRLRDAGLLRGAANGLELFPRWVAVATYRATLGRMIRDDVPSVWGRLAADESRQPVVDASLDELVDGDFHDVVRAVAKHAPVTLGETGAIDAAFAACSRRVMRHGFAIGKHLQSWQRLGEQQTALLVKHPGDAWELHRPLTRPAPEGWFADGWPFSLNVERPKTFHRTDLSWDLPGWSQTLRLADLPSYPLLVFPGTNHGRRISHVAVAALRRVADTKLPDELPPILVPAAIELAGEKGWRITEKHLRALGSHAPTTGLALACFLVERLRRMSESERAQIAAVVWAAIVAPGDVVAAIDAFADDHPLLNFVLDNITVDLFSATLKDDGFGTNPRVLALLPARLKTIALRWWAKPRARAAPSFDKVRQMLGVFSPTDVDLALELAQAVDENAAAEFFAIVWRLDPRRARDEVTQAVKNGSGTIHGWFATSPAIETAFLSELLTVEQAHATPWFRDWGLARLARSGAAAERLFVRL